MAPENLLKRIISLISCLRHAEVFFLSLFSYVALSFILFLPRLLLLFQGHLHITDRVIG